MWTLETHTGKSKQRCVVFKGAHSAFIREEQKKKMRAVASECTVCVHVTYSVCECAYTMTRMHFIHVSIWVCGAALTLLFVINTNISCRDDVFVCSSWVCLLAFCACASVAWCCECGSRMVCKGVIWFCTFSVWVRGFARVWTTRSKHTVIIVYFHVVWW